MTPRQSADKTPKKSPKASPKVESKVGPDGAKPDVAAAPDAKTAGRGAPADLIFRARSWLGDNLRDDETRRHLPLSVILEEGAPPRIVRAAVVTISMLVLGFIVWSSVTRFAEVAQASGEILPDAALRPVQHLEGGIVKDILVEDGQLVKAGDPLIAMDPTAATSDRDRLQARLQALKLEAARLRAFVLKQDPDFGEVPAAFWPLQAEQESILATQRQSRDAQAAVLETQLDERKRELDALKSQEQTLTRQLELVSEEADMRKKLVDQGLTSRITYLATQRAHNKAEGDLNETVSRQAQVRAEMAESESRVIELDSKLRNDALNQIGRLSAEIAEVTEEFQKSQNRVNRLTVLAPVNGLVKGLLVKSPGDVIQPGAVVAEIVPTDTPLVAQVRIAPQDIGHVKLGKDAIVKVSSYDFARYGGLNGTVTQLSASTFMDERGRPYFKGTISFDGHSVGNDANPILPGMTVTADIKTGDKSLMAYLIRPVYNSLDTAFHER